MTAPLAVPPKIRPAGLSGFTWILLGFCLAGLLGTVYFFDPAVTPLYPQCRFHAWTGWNCPGCGATRCLYALLHGRFAQACQDNALLLAALILAPLRFLWWWTRTRPANPAAPVLPLGAWWLLLVVALVFAVLRNLPAFAFLSPA